MAQTQIAVCPQINTFSSMTRGYYFTAPCDFVICGLYIPTDASTGLQSVEVVRFTAGAPPAYSATTNSFVSLFYQSNWPTNTMIPCNVQVNTGDIIGVYGSRGAAVNSYGAANCATTIMGNAVTLYRSGMQFDLATQQMHDIWYEDYNIGRVFMYINCCPTADFTIDSVICLGDTATAVYTGSGVPPATTFDWDFNGGTPATANTIGPHDVTWATPGVKTVTLDVFQASCATASESHTVNVLAPPTISASASPASICDGENTTLTASGGDTYLWSTGGTGSSINVNPASSTTYTVTGTTTAGCTGTASVYVTVSPLPVITVANQTICDGETATLSANGAATYSWSNGGNTAAISVSPSSTTVYTVTGTSAAGCTGTASATVTVNPLPNITISANPASVCAGNSSTLTASGGTNYSWSTSSTGSSITVNPTSTTTYGVTGTDANGCSNTADINVTVLPGPVVTATGATICEGATANITASGAANYTWDNSMTGSSINVNPTSTTTYTVSGTDGSGCTGTATAVVTVNPLPVITTTNDEICEGETATITASGGTTYTWSSGGNGSTENVTPSTTTTYSVTGTDANGCSNTNSAVVTVNQNPSIAISTTPDACNSSNGTATATPTGGLSPYLYEWSTSPAQTTNPATNLSANTYTVTVTDDNGCTATASAVVDPLAGFTLSSATTDEHCDMEDGTATVVVTGALGPLTYVWSHDPGLNSPNANGISAGTYTVSVDDGTCQDVITITVYAQPGPVAGFMVNPTQADLENALFTITDLSIGGTSWMYYFDDGGFSNMQNPTHTYTSEGEYTITQYVYDDYSCEDSASMSVTVEGLFAFYIPNAFSPNGDNRNDYFLPKGIGIDPDTWIMRIYDRWGHTVFVSTDINQPWDGEYTLEDINKTPTAVFGYFISFKTESGILKKYYGHVTTLP